MTQFSIARHGKNSSFLANSGLFLARKQSVPSAYISLEMIHVIDLIALARPAPEDEQK
jgi:hypothetical protein